MATTVKVTTKGREIISGRMIGASPTQAEPLNIGWGVGTSTASINDVNLFKDAAESRVAGTSSQVTGTGGTPSTNDTYQVIGTITSLSAQTIAEALLSDSLTKPFSTTVASGAIIGSSSGTTFTSGASYTPANNTFIQVDAEVMKVTAGTGTTSLTVTRAQNGTTAIATIAATDGVVLGNVPGGSVANASCCVHASFTGLALNINDSIQFTFQVQIQSS